MTVQVRLNKTENALNIKLDLSELDKIIKERFANGYQGMNNGEGDSLGDFDTLEDIIFDYIKNNILEDIVLDTREIYDESLFNDNELNEKEQTLFSFRG